MSDDPLEMKAKIRELVAELARTRKEKSQASGEGDDVSAANGRIEELLEEIEASELNLQLVEKFGEKLGVVVRGERVVGVVAVKIPGGSSKQARSKLLDDALAERLDQIGRELSVVFAAAPSRYVIERQGRDDQGRTIFDVLGLVEGDAVVPTSTTGRRPGRRAG